MHERTAFISSLNFIDMVKGYSKFFSDRFREITVTPLRFLVPFFSLLVVFMPKQATVSTTVAGDTNVVRLLLLGDSAVGKSSLLLRFCEGRFENNFVITIGVDFKTKSMNIDGRQYRVQVWDTAGQERFRTITPAYYRNASGVQIIFDVTNRKSFESTPS